MPNININLGDVQAWENLPLGTYLGEIAKITYREANEEGKFAQIMASYTVIDGDSLGKTQSEFLSLSPKALGRLKRWFMKFGLGDVAITDESFNDEDELIEPDLTGVRVIFSVYEDPKPYKGEKQIRTALVSVEDDMSPAAPAARAAAPARPAARKAPEPVAEPEPEPEPVDPKAAARAALEAQLAALNEADDEPAEVEVPAPAPRKAAAPAAAAAAAAAARAPQRRTFR